MQLSRSLTEAECVSRGLVNSPEFHPSLEDREVRNSGTGEHVVCFAKALPGLEWQPSDPDRASRASIAAWIASEGLANIRAPVAIDMRHATWGIE